MVIRGLNDITAVQSRVTSAGIYFTAKYYFNAQNGQMILHFRNPGTNTLIRALDPLYADVDGNLVLSGQPKTYVSPTFIQNDATLFLPTSVIPRGSKSINVEAAIYDPVQRQYLDTPLTFEVKLAR